MTLQMLSLAMHLMSSGWAAGLIRSAVKICGSQGGLEKENNMSLTHILAVTNRWLKIFLREQAEMSAQVELFMEAVPWRTES